MSIRGRTLSTAFALLFLAGMADAQAATIPQAEGTTLTGAEVKLPEGMNDKLGVLVVGFSRGSREQVAAWGRKLAVDFGHSQKVMYFEVPMLAGAPKILRGMIVRQMGSSVPEKERSHFLPLTENEAGWRTVTHYSRSDDAYVLLTNRTGTVLWQAQGDATDTAYTQLKTEIAALTAAGDHR
jgi:hypothetical protein